MDAALEAQVWLRLQNYQIENLQLKKRIDPSYYWSFILRIGDKYNASVANRLQVLKELSN
jgi:hypothetical protein